MTRLFNDPESFADEMVEGFVAANAGHVRRVPGGVVRAQPAPRGTVAVVIGGGSGHYPAFAGLVGPGLAHGAAMGNIFASPAAQQVYDVARAADRGGGVLLSYGNYAGDVLNFDEAQERLNAWGVECRTVTVTDDVASAPAAERHRRRGIAGDLTVFKVAGSAADRGDDLQQVVRLAQRTNDRTRSFGVAFSGCTLPGAGAPLFEVPAGRMAVGLGIHGEPGVDEVPVPTADGLAELLVARLLAEQPDDAGTAGQRVVPILNGLGAAKYEELFVVYRRVHALMADAGLTPVDPHVGEFCTSLDMAGVSLTFLWLDDELEPLWAAPVDTPAYRRGRPETVVPAASGPAAAEPAGEPAGDAAAEVAGPASEASREAARAVLAALEAAGRALDEAAPELGRIDAVAGDGDHGIGMQRGVHAALASARAGVAAGHGAGTTLRHAGQDWAARAGGTSGALWGAALVALAGVLGDDAAPSGPVVADAVAAAADAVERRGKAAVGDKTMVDALVPLRDTLAAAVAAGRPLGEAAADAARAATEAAQATADLTPRIGRARTHGGRSVGTPDPGAVSLALVATTVVAALTAEGAPS